MIKAGSNLRISRLALQQYEDLDLQQAAYHVQQALEKTIKFFLQANGVSFRKTHNVSLLCEKLPKEQKVFTENDLDFIYTRADTIEKWENEVRYETDYMATRRQVVPVLEFVTDLHRRVKLWYDSYTPENTPVRVGSLKSLELK